VARSGERGMCRNVKKKREILQLKGAKKKRPRVHAQKSCLRLKEKGEGEKSQIAR